MDILITSFIKRPYVFAFLFSYIIIATRVTGSRWMIFYLFTGYTVAFISEFLSINYGFPYGWYFYIYENLQGEWINNGVPVWDSVSYVFMCFAGLYAAYYSLYRNGKTPSRLKLILLSAVFTTILDIIIDPVSHMGDRWFLGKIYFYPHPGIYFDITLANFVGWFIVSSLINAIGVLSLGFQPKITKINSFLSLGLYYGIFLFGCVIAIYLQEWTLTLTNFFWLIVTLGIIFTGHLDKSSNNNVLEPSKPSLSKQ